MRLFDGMSSTSNGGIVLQIMYVIKGLYKINHNIICN